jgi:hypothetical protein
LLAAHLRVPLKPHQRLQEIASQVPITALTGKVGNGTAHARFLRLSEHVPCMLQPSSFEHISQDQFAEESNC